MFSKPPDRDNYVIFLASEVSYPNSLFSKNVHSVLEYYNVDEI